MPQVARSTDELRGQRSVTPDRRADADWQSTSTFILWGAIGVLAGMWVNVLLLFWGFPDSDDLDKGWATGDESDVGIGGEIGLLLFGLFVVAITGALGFVAGDEIGTLLQGKNLSFSWSVPAMYLALLAIVAAGTWFFPPMRLLSRTMTQGKFIEKFVVIVPLIVAGVALITVLVYLVQFARNK